MNIINEIKFIDQYKCIRKGSIFNFNNTENYQVLVGLNGSGKTSILDAIFYTFGDVQNQNLQYLKPNKIAINGHLLNGKDDFNTKDYDNPFNLQCIFYLYSKRDFNRRRIPKIGKIYCSFFGYLNLDIFLLYLLGDPDDILKGLGINLYNYLEKLNINDDISTLYNEFHIKALSNCKETKFSLLEKKEQKRIAKIILLNCDFSKTLNVPTFSKELSRISSIIARLSTAEKEMIIIKLFTYIVGERDLILLDEPDANLDMQNKKKVFNMIDKCIGQVILTTHDPIMSNWMKDHLVFLQNGIQVPAESFNYIRALSDNELTYQESLLIFKKKYIVVVEGKSDVNCIERAITNLDLSQYFDELFFLPQNSSTASNSTYENVISKLFANNDNLEKILYLYDADDAGWKGKEQIEKIKKENPNDSLAQKMDFLFYRSSYDENYKPFNNDIKDYFYLEGYFPTDCYPENNNSVINHIPKSELFDNLGNMIANEDLNFNEISRLKFFVEKISKNNGLKSYFGNKLDKVPQSAFENFRPLLYAILDKLGLPKPPNPEI